MTRCMSFALVALMVGAVVAAGNAQTGGKAGSDLPSFTGLVKAVSATSLFVQRGDSGMLFVVDSTTRVFARGNARDLVFRERQHAIPEFVKVGNQVTVRYSQSSGVGIKAVEVRVTQN